MLLLHWEETWEGRKELWKSLWSCYSIRRRASSLHIHSFFVSGGEYVLRSGSQVVILSMWGLCKWIQFWWVVFKFDLWVENIWWVTEGVQEYGFPCPLLFKHGSRLQISLVESWVLPNPAKSFRFQPTQFGVMVRVQCGARIGLVVAAIVFILVQVNCLPSNMSVVIFAIFLFLFLGSALGFWRASSSLCW